MQNLRRWRARLLVIELSALAILAASLYWLGQMQQAGQPIHGGWLVIPALASLLVFLSFLGLMYLRWAVATEGNRKNLHRALFMFLAVVLLSIWALAISRTWQSFQSASVPAPLLGVG